MDISYYKQYEPFFESWYITRELGEGAYGRVFEIERKDEFGSMVYHSALKVITVPSNSAELNSTQFEGMDEKSMRTYFYSIVQKFVREFEIMYKLKGSNNIVNYEDHRVVPHKSDAGYDIFIRMELLTPVNEFFAKKENLSVFNIVKLGADICGALERCHAEGIIHRDVKPANILVNKDGDFKLGDFGVSRVVESTISDLTRVGSVSYMPPEVYLGKNYDFSADIYSLGMVMYRLLNNNRLPFYPDAPNSITIDDKDVALSNRIKGESMPAPANGEDELTKTILRMCAFELADRFASVRELKEIFEKMLHTASKERIPSVTGIYENEEPEENSQTIKTQVEQTHDTDKSAKGSCENEDEKVPNQEQLPIFEPKPSLKRKLIIICALIAVLLVAVSIVGVLLLEKFKDKDNLPSEDIPVQADYAEMYLHNNSDIEATVKEYVKSVSEESILTICYADFDFNGTEEAFAITGTISSESVAEYENCTVYYANDVSCIEISEKNLSLTEYEGAVGRIVENEDNCFFTFETSGYYSPTVYTVYNNEVKEIPVLTDYNCHGLFCKNNTFYTYDQSDNKDVMLKVKRTQFGCAQGLVPYLVSPNDIEMTRIFAENESVWLNSDVSSFTFIDLDGEAPLELATLNSSEDNDYSSYIAFYKVDAKNKTVEQILCNDYIECGYLSGFTFMNLYRNIYSGELIYSVNNNYLKLINGKIYNFSEDIVNEGDALLYSSYFAVTYGEYAYDKDFLALSYARFKYDGYSEDTSSNYGSMQDAYKAVLNNYNQNSEYISELDGYFMFDIDDNDIHELIVVRNYQMIECCYDFYTYSDGRPIFVGTIFDSHSSLYVVESGKQLNLQSAYMGYENIMLIGLSKYRIDTLMIFEKEYEPDSFDDYSKVDGIYVDLFAFDDLSLIENPEIVAENYYETLEENKTANQSEEKTTYKNWLSGLFG